MRRARDNLGRRLLLIMKTNIVCYILEMMIIMPKFLGVTEMDFPSKWWLSILLSNIYILENKDREEDTRRWECDTITCHEHMSCPTWPRTCLASSASGATQKCWQRPSIPGICRIQIKTPTTALPTTSWSQQQNGEWGQWGSQIIFMTRPYIHFEYFEYISYLTFYKV